MGFSPQQVDGMSMWQFFAALNGYIDANTPREKGKITSEAEAAELFRWTEEASSRVERKFSTLVYALSDDGRSLHVSAQAEWAC